MRQLEVLKASDVICNFHTYLQDPNMLLLYTSSIPIKLNSQFIVCMEEIIEGQGSQSTVKTMTDSCWLEVSYFFQTIWMKRLTAWEQLWLVHASMWSGADLGNAWFAFPSCSIDEACDFNTAWTYSFNFGKSKQQSRLKL